MGAVDFSHQITSESAIEGYKMLVDEANYQEGNNSSNGTIATCSMGRKTLTFPKLLKSNTKKAIEHIEEQDGGIKWEANYIDLGVDYWEVTTIKKKTHIENKPKYEMMYVVVIERNLKVMGHGIPNGVERGLEFKTKKEADDKAIRELVNNPNGEVYVEKRYVLKEGESRVTEFIKEVKEYKTKPKLKAMPNRVVRPFNKYVFYGLANE